MEHIGAAIIGCGSIFPLHAKTLKDLDGVTLKMVIDSDPSKAAQAASVYGCESAEDYKVLLSRADIQVVHLCTPHYLHAEMAIDLLAAGKHVLTEKPLAESLSSAKGVLEAAKKSLGQLGVCFQNRYNEASRIIRETISSGSLGELICMKGIVTWHRDPAYYTNSSWRGKWESEGGGVLINQTIHTLDLLQWFGGEITSVKGSVTTDALEDVIEVEDTAHACIDFTSGTRALFYGTTAYAIDAPVELEIVFEHGSLHQRRESLYLWKDNQETRLCQPPQNSSGGKSYWGASHSSLIADFYDHIREGRQFWINGKEALKTLQMISDLYRSSLSNKTAAGKPE